MRRVFLGLPLPDAVRSSLAVQQFLLPLPQKVEPAQMHLTLVFLGALSDPVLEAVHEGFTALRSPAFSLTAQGFGLFGGARPRAAWAGVAPSEPLIRLHSKAERAARVAGCDLPARRFAPHITLGRFAPPGPADTARLERAIAMGAAFRAGPWPVDEMVLWESHLSPRGPRYDALVRYRLEGGTAFP